MREMRDRPRLAIESLAELRVRGERLRQDLDRDRAIQARVPRFIDLAHTARAERRQNFVRAESSAGGYRHVGWSLADYSGYPGGI